MVKKKFGAARLREKVERRLKAGASAALEGNTAGNEESAQAAKGMAIPTHLQRKVARKVKFLERVAASRPDALAPRNAIKKRRRRRKEGPGPLGSLGTLAASLAEAAKEHQSRVKQRLKGLGVHGTKKRLRLVQKETERLHLVCGNQTYRNDPLAAISSHLEARLPPLPEASAPAPAVKKLTKAEKKKRAVERRFMKQLDSQMAD
eukprot:jgi/Botrbrau1/935/Bobra.0167s0046.1